MGSVLPTMEMFHPKQIATPRPLHAVTHEGTVIARAHRRMSAALSSDTPVSDALTHALVAFALRFRRPPRALVVVADQALRREVARRLAGRGLHVVELADTRGLHAEVLRTLEDPAGRPIDLIVAADDLRPVSALHAIGFAQSQRVCAAAVLLTEGAVEETGVYPCAPQADVVSFERHVLRGLQRLFSRPQLRVAPSLAPGSR